MKKSILLLLISIIFISCCSIQKNDNPATAINKDYDLYKVHAYYPKKLQPGDALFIRLKAECSDRSLAKSLFEKSEKPAPSGLLSLYKIEEGQLSEKALRKTKFYTVKADYKKKNARVTLLAGLPLSTWWNEGDYLVKAEFSVFGMEKNEITISTTLLQKEFISETIPLNASNTAIKTNTGKTRMTQINRLNEILAAKNWTSLYSDKPFTPPTTATRRTSFFADRRTYAYSNGKSSTSLHYGLDYGVPTGTDVYSCGDGKVVLAEDRVSTGWSLCIEHLPGLYSLYYHMSELKVNEGDLVKAGDFLGYSGATGLATGPHLHWEIRLNMEAVDPDFMCTDFTHSQEAGKHLR